MGIEPTSKAWEAYHITQKHAGLAAFLQFSERLNWKIMENGKRAGFTTIATAHNKFGRAKVQGERLLCKHEPPLQHLLPLLCLLNVFNNFGESASRSK